MPLIARTTKEKRKPPTEAWVEAARAEAERLEAANRGLREKLDQDLSKVYESPEWKAACAKVAEIRQLINKADFGADPGAMSGLVKRHEKAKADRDKLIEKAHLDYYRDCEE